MAEIDRRKLTSLEPWKGFAELEAERQGNMHRVRRVILNLGLATSATGPGSSTCPSMPGSASTGLGAARSEGERRGLIARAMDRLAALLGIEVPEGYEDETGFHYGKYPPKDMA